MTRCRNTPGGISIKVFRVATGSLEYKENSNKFSSFQVIYLTGVLSVIQNPTFEIQSVHFGVNQTLTSRVGGRGGTTMQKNIGDAHRKMQFKS